MSPRAVWIVHLWLAGDDVAAFERFERSASALLARHGGRIDRALRSQPPSLSADVSADVPFEVHVVSFPDEASFERYRADPDTLALAAIRQQVIARTDLRRVVEVGPYDGEPT